MRTQWPTIRPWQPATLERFLIETQFAIEHMRHRSGPRQIVKSLILVSNLFSLDRTHDSDDPLVKDPELLAAFQPLVNLASARRMGGALRVTAKRSD